MTESALGVRTLNRALLQRQLLIERAELNAEQAVTHLAGLQAQAVNPPYIGLWTRIQGFRIEQLEAGLTGRRLVRIASEEGRKARPGLKLGVCGEHGGDPDSVHFFHEVGLDYVSCSPFRVPIARLEAGRAAIESAGSDHR